ncbi:MAG TPA: hypothetical protein VMV11_05345 [Acidimicrobiales bacterium]|nr:hypothetical protein [Acidimicrobiales bacterium]
MMTSTFGVIDRNCVAGALTTGGRGTVVLGADEDAKGVGATVLVT